MGLRFYQFCPDIQKVFIMLNFNTQMVFLFRDRVVTLKVRHMTHPGTFFFSRADFL